MFKNYFLYENELPPDVGFRLFDCIHISWLVGIFLFGLIVVMTYKKASDKSKQRYEKSIGIIMVLLHLCKDLVLIATGNFHVWELPLNMCAIALFVCLLHAFTHTKTTGEILYCICMPGALAALIFPNWNYYPQLNFMNLYSFITHGLIVIYTLMLLISGNLRPNIKNYIRVWIFLLGAVAVASFINCKYQTNFLFLSIPSKASPLVTIYNITGERLYLVGFGLIVIGVNMVMYLPFIIGNQRKKCSCIGISNEKYETFIDK